MKLSQKTLSKLLSMPILITVLLGGVGIYYNTIGISSASNNKIKAFAEFIVWLYISFLLLNFVCIILLNANSKIVFTRLNKILFFILILSMLFFFLSYSYVSLIWDD